MSAPSVPEPLVRFSRGEISRQEACEALGLRDYAQLLVALGAANLALPQRPDAEVEAMADTFVRIWETA